MSKFDEKEVLHAALHTPIHIAGFGQAGPSLDKSSAKEGGTFRVFKALDGLDLEIMFRGKLIEAFVPSGTVKNITMAPSPAAPAKLEFKK